MAKSDEKELEDFMNIELEKDITQEDSIDKSVKDDLGEMGFLWDTVNKKLAADSICFGCKKKIDPSKKENLSVLQASKVEPGTIAFVSICDECKKEIEKKADKPEVKEK